MEMREMGGGGGEVGRGRGRRREGERESSDGQVKSSSARPVEGTRREVGMEVRERG